MQVEMTQSLEKPSRQSAYVTTPLVGNSTKMRLVRTMIAKLAASNSTVLITGESGTGKELAARAIHELSSRRAEPFVPVNCGAIPEELLESELFGHVRGAFTGAVSTRQGRFQLANGGTLFLDEVGEMSPKLQVKLLRLVQERQFEPVGSDAPVHVDVRVIAATNRDLHIAVQEGKFREDLFYRLNVLPLELPSLRERDGDVPLLIRHFFNLHGRRKDKLAIAVEDNAMELLARYRWPGNVREVENLIERLVVLNEQGVVRAEDLPDYVINNATPQHQATNQVLLPAEGLDLDGFLENIENGFIQQALLRTRGNKTVAAELLNLNRTTFIERLRKKGMLQSARRSSTAVSCVRNMTASNFPLTTSVVNTWNTRAFDQIESMEISHVSL